MENIRYFQAGPSDAEIVTELRLIALEIFQGPRPAELINEMRAAFLPSIAEMLNNGSYICWLAELNGSMIGSGGMSIRNQPGNFTNPSGRSEYLMNMYTQPEFRGNGICSELVKRLIGSGKEQGISHFELHATPSGEPVYQKLGFQKHNEPTYRLQVS